MSTPINWHLEFLFERDRHRYARGIRRELTMIAITCPTE